MEKLTSNLQLYLLGQLALASMIFTGYMALVRSSVLHPDFNYLTDKPEVAIGAEAFTAVVLSIILGIIASCIGVDTWSKSSRNSQSLWIPVAFILFLSPYYPLIMGKLERPISEFDAGIRFGSMALVACISIMICLVLFKLTVENVPKLINRVRESRKRKTTVQLRADDIRSKLEHLYQPLATGEQLRGGVFRRLIDEFVDLTESIVRLTLANPDVYQHKLDKVETLVDAVTHFKTNYLPLVYHAPDSEAIGKVENELMPAALGQLHIIHRQTRWYFEAELKLVSGDNKELQPVSGDNMLLPALN